MVEHKTIFHLQIFVFKLYYLSHNKSNTHFFPTPNVLELVSHVNMNYFNEKQAAFLPSNYYFHDE